MSKLLTQIDISKFFQFGPSGVGEKYPTIGTFISVILPNLMVIAGIILLFLLIGAGFSMVGAKTDPERAAAAQRAVTGAVIGLVLIFAAWWIIEIIEKLTGVEIFTPGF